MRLLHTSDWHLGKMLYAKKERQNEHAAFLDWLLTAIRENMIDLLIVAGDIFDTSSPGSSSQKMYYDFLLKVRNFGCQNVVIIGGNHDSPGFLNAPKEILSALNINVIGNADNDIRNEIIVIHNKNNEPIAILCAVPFLRERDISRFTEGETYSDRSKRIAERIKNHYIAIAEIAEETKNKIKKNIPVIATGHLSVAGGKTIADDGVREIYIGGIECVGSEIFPKIFDYVALGHYHISSIISQNVRYCGSPIPMGFGEAEQKKYVYIVDFGEENRIIHALEIPIFQKLKSIRGNKSFIAESLAELKESKSPVWVEIIYEGNDVFPDFAAWVHEQIDNTQIEILKLQNRQSQIDVFAQNDSMQSLKELNKFDVFDKLLEKNGISEEQKIDLKEIYREIIVGLSVNNIL